MRTTYRPAEAHVCTKRLQSGCLSSPDVRSCDRRLSEAHAASNATLHSLHRVKGTRCAQCAMIRANRGNNTPFMPLCALLRRLFTWF